MAPKGVSMRLPPVNGLARSAVWQLAQSPVSVSALPLAITSADGSALPSRQKNALHKTKPTRIARTPWRGLGIIHPSLADRERHAISRKTPRTTRTATRHHYSRHEIANLESCAELNKIVVRRLRK